MRAQSCRRRALALLVTEGYQRVDPRSPARRQVTANAATASMTAVTSVRVNGSVGLSPKSMLEIARVPTPGREADRGGSTGDAVGHHAVETERGEQESGGAEEAGEVGDEPFWRK